MKSTLTRSLLSTLFAGTLLLPAALHALPCELPIVLTALDPQSQDDPAYLAGNRAMDDKRWHDAVREFDKVIAAKSSRADAALYWKAYALQKLSHSSDAASSCNLLQAQYPASSWNNDCKALVLQSDVQARIQAKVNAQIDAATQNIVIPPIPPIPPIPTGSWYKSDRPEPGSDADLKLLALNSLLHQDPARAMPILKGLLTGNQPMSVKKQVIFVLAQSKSPEAAAMLHDAVLGKMDPALQLQAIQMMGVFQGKRSNDTLADVYRSTSDIQVKKAIISAFFVSQDAPRMVELARSEKNLELKRSIVSQLALMNDKAATDYMIELLK